MTLFQDREKAFEEKFHHEQDQLFRVHAKRANLFGLFIAQKMALPSPAAETYAQSLVELQLLDTNTQGLLTKVTRDLEDAGVVITAGILEEELTKAGDKALDLLRAPPLP